MNGVASGRSPYDYGASNLSPAGSPAVGGKAAVDEFARNMLVGEDREAQQYAPVSDPVREDATPPSHKSDALCCT